MGEGNLYLMPGRKKTAAPPEEGRRIVLPLRIGD